MTELLHIEYDRGTADIMGSAGEIKGYTIDGRFLPREVYHDADPSFLNEQDLARLCQTYDGLVLDWTTFGHSIARGGPGSRLPRYLGAVLDSGYQGPIVITTTNLTETQSALGAVKQRVTILEKPFDLDDLFRAFERGEQ